MALDAAAARDTRDGAVRRASLGVAAAVLYVLTIVAANEAVKRYGPVPVGFGLMAPAGVYFAGLAFTLRDITQRWLGKASTLAVIAAGSIVSYQFGAGRIALAAALAFAVSELIDFAVFLAVERRRGLVAAVAASNVAGLLVDSWLFLTVAFGSLGFFWGQVVGKAWMTAAAVALLLAARRAVTR